MRSFAVVGCVGLFAAGGLMSTGCATIVNGKTQEIPVATTPPGATITLDSGQSFITPTTMTLRRNKDYIATVTKDGYQTQTLTITGVLSGWLLGNIVFGGLIGGGVDAATGSGFTLTPDKLNLTLTALAPGQTAAPPISGTVSLDERERIAEQMHKDGLIDDKALAAIKKKIEEERKKPVAPAGG